MSYDEIIDALKTLDKDGEANTEPLSACVDDSRRLRSKSRMRRFGGLGLCSYRNRRNRRSSLLLR